MKSIKCISLILLLFAVLFISIVSISAADVNDSVTCDVNADDSGYLQDNMSDYGNVSFKSSAAGENGIIESNVNDDFIKENRSLENNLKISIDLNNVTNSSQYSIFETSPNTYILTYPDNTTSSVCRLGIYDADSFRKVSDLISKNDVVYDILIIEFKENLNLEIDPWTNELLNAKNFKNIIIRGNGAKISIRDPKKNAIQHFLYVGSSDLVSMSNITLEGFNTAILNHGKCELANVYFKENVIDFRLIKTQSISPMEIHLHPFEPAPDHKNENDYGGAIRNFGILDCRECSFTDNFAQSGGAVYNYEGTQSTFINCKFRGNKIYICLNPMQFVNDFEYAYDYDGGFYGDARSKVRLGAYEGFDCNNDYDIHTCDRASCMVYNDNDTIYSVSINSTGDLMNFINNERNIQYMKYCVLNLLADTTYYISHDFETMKFKNIEILLIRGNGATICVKDSDSSEECHFMEIIPSATCIIQDLTLKGFNTAFINRGSLFIQNSKFISNTCDYVIEKDYGGAIYNKGILTVTYSSFERGYAKYGGAVYNEKGIVILNSCNFTSNKAYGDGGALYNNFGVFISQNSIFTGNCAEKGGSIFNHYAKFSSINDIFAQSSAEDEGGAIYNDYGELIIGNDTFINSKADDGKDVYSYGDEAKYTIISESFSVRKNGDDVSIQTMKVTEDAPSEFVRWGIRIAEVVLCVALCVGCSLLGIPEASAGVICFVGGALLAGAEEIIEECCFEHNFNAFNVLMMMVVAGIFDGVTGAIGSWVGITFFSTATAQLTAKESFKLTAICFTIELVGEILTEALPRIDFRDIDIPSSLVNPETVAVKIN